MEWNVCCFAYRLRERGCEVWKKESVNLGALLFSPFSPSHSLFTEHSKPYFIAAIIFLSRNASYGVQEPRTKKESRVVYY